MSYQFKDVFEYNHITTTEIARGGQGAVFRTQNPNIAIKVELDPSGSEFSRDIKQNGRLDEIRLLPISKRINITLPQATLKEYAGYVMTLLDDMESFEKAFDYSFYDVSDYSNEWLDQFRETAPEFVEVIAQYLKSGGRRRRLEAYLNVACMLSELHASGLVYCDFSAKNAYISNVEGNNTVWLIDADNLNYQEKTRGSVFFTPGYGAPEVIRGKGCTFYSDSYAFAISFFWQLTGTHPFKGASMESDFDDDFADDKEELANNGVFPWIMDTEDTSNYIDARIQQTLVISNHLIRYFDRTFCRLGKEKRQTRPTMFEWSEAIAKELDLSVKCKCCEMDYDSSYDNCPWCDTKTSKICLTAKKQDRIIWKYVRETGNGEAMLVPRRLIRGFRNTETEDYVFTINYNNDEISIEDLDEMFEWSVSTDQGDSYIDIYGRTVISNECTIKAVDKKSRESVVVEVSKI